MKVHLFTLSFFLTLPCLALNLNAGSAIYAPLFGTQNAREQYQKIIQQALQEFGYTDFEKVSIKKMNSMAQKLIGAQLYSFTLFGIWLNEELLEQENETIRYWLLYHEAAHVALHHHAKALGLCATLIPAVCTIYYLSKNVLDSSIGSLAATSLFSYGLLTYALKPYIREQEKEADLAVVRLLCSTKKTDIIKDYLNYLRARIADGDGNATDGWHYTIAQQYEYIYGTVLFWQQ